MKNNGNVKKTWSLINSLLRRKNVKKEITLNNDSDQNIESRSVSNFFNNYFTDVAHRMGLLVFNIDNAYLDYVNPVLFSIFMCPSTHFEVKNLIDSLPLKNTQLNDIPVKILRLVSTPLSHWLSSFYNSFVDMGLYPTAFKVGRIIPLFKNGKSLNVSNYRPISTLLSLNKIFEKLTFNRLNNYFEANNIISDRQHGFRKGKNTTSAILQLVSNLLGGFHNKNYTVCIFLDLKKAFDSVNHSILLHKLHCYGIRGNVHDFIQSYLTDRYQYTNVNDVDSDMKLVRSGIPQGSTLGPLLFNIFINDIVTINNYDATLYADDAVFYIQDSTLNGCIVKLNNLIVCLSKWLNCNLLIPNTDKFCL